MSRIKYRNPEEMKDSGVEWLGMVPEDWGVTKVKYYYDIQLGKMLQPNKKSEQDTLEKYLCTININWDGINFNAVKKMWFKMSERTRYLVQNGDLVVNEGGDAGKAVIVNNINERIYIQNAVHRVRSKKNSEVRFLYYWLFNLKMNGYINLICNKATIMHFTVDKFKELLLVLPNTCSSKQVGIANFLDIKSARINNIITKKENLIKKLKKAKQSLISEVVTGKVKIVDGKMVQRNQDEMKDSGVEWIGMVPNDWDISKLKHQTIINKKSLAEHTSAEYELKYLDISSVDGNGKVIHFEHMLFKNAPSRARRIVSNKDTLVSTVRTYLKAITWFDKADTNLICSTGFAVLTPKNTIDPKYLSLLMRSSLYIEEIVSRSVGVSYPSINATEIGRLECLLPPLNEQSAIVIFVDNIIFKVESLIINVGKQIEKLKECRQSLISEAVTGKIDLRDYNRKN